MEKTFAEMTFQERVNWAAGELILAIGEGRFRERLWTVCSTFNGDAWDRGIEEGIKRVKKQQEYLQQEGK
jgi:hypothetical protein